MAAVSWYLAQNGQRLGPFNSHQLMQLAGCGFLKRTDLVLPKGATKWLQAAGIPGLFASEDQKKFWLSYKGNTRGPYVVEQLKAGLATGEWTADAQVWSDEDGQVMPLSQLPDLSEYEPPAISRSQAQLLTGSLEIEEAALHIAGKSGDEMARLMSLLMDLKRVHANNPALVESLDRSIAAIRSKREKNLQEAGKT